MPCCYQCAKFVGPIEEEQWDEEGTDGMCPEESVYIDAFDDACSEFIPRDPYIIDLYMSPVESWTRVVNEVSIGEWS